MKISYWKILVGIAVFGLCLGAAFGAGTVYGRHTKTNNASAAAANTQFNRTSQANQAGGSGTDSNARSTAASQASASQSGTPQAGGFPGAGRGFIGGFAGRPIEANVASVSNSQLQLTFSFGGRTSGTSTNVALDGQTTYYTTQKGDSSSLKSGASVYVTSTTASDGTLTAQSIIVLPANFDTSASSTSGGQSSGATGASGASTGSRGSFGGGFGGNRPTEGTVKSVNGQQLTFSLANGSTTTVNLSSQTSYTTTQKADQSAVTKGASLLLTLNGDSSGSATAQSIIVLPASSGQTG